MLVVDANILIRAVLGRQVWELIENYAGQGVRFFAPADAFQDAERYLPELLMKRGRPADEAAKFLDYLHQSVEVIPYEAYYPFEEAARERLRGRDEDDWPVLAAALALGCDVWSEDADFFGTGIPVWTTRRVEIYLRAQTSQK